jgi:geranylgeranyl reductase family protein
VLIERYNKGYGVYDIIVVGAGPAGSAAARTAARLGLDALLIERERFPRYKACGGALSERASSYLDFNLPEEIAEKEIAGARVYFKNNVVEVHKGYRLTTMVSRSAFDDFMVHKALDAGARAIIGCKVDGYEEKDDRVDVHTKDGAYSSKFLVIASGCQDALRQRIRGRDRTDQYGVCVVAEIPEDDAKIDERLDDVLEIHFGAANMGYGWIFPHRGYYSVGIGGLTSRLKHPRQTMMRFLRSHGFPGQYSLHGHMIPFGGMERRTADGRVILAGDSAGFVDAFSGEGIAYAIRSGQIASEVTAEGITENVSREYAARCRAEFGDDLRYALLFSKMMHSRPDLFFRILTSQERFIDKYVETLALKRSYKSYVKWLLPRIPGSFLPI